MLPVPGSLILHVAATYSSLVFNTAVISCSLLFSFLSWYQSLIATWTAHWSLGLLRDRWSTVSGTSGTNANFGHCRKGQGLNPSYFLFLLSVLPDKRKAPKVWCTVLCAVLQFSGKAPYRHRPVSKSWVLFLTAVTWRELWKYTLHNTLT